MAPDLARWREYIDAYHAAFGPLTQAELVAGAHHSLAGHYKGETMWLIWRRPDSTRAALSLHLALSLGGRPVRVALYPRGEGWEVSGPTITTNDPTFDAKYIVSAVPPEVVHHALDAETRRRILSRHEAISFQHGFALISAEVMEDAGLKMRSRPPSPQEAAARAEDLHFLVSKLRRSYDEARAEIVAGQGEPAAAAWQARWEETLRAAKKESASVFTAGGAPFVIGCTLAILAALLLLLLPLAVFLNVFFQF